MAKTSYGAGTIFKRGKIWYVSFWVEGRQVQKSCGSERRQDAVLLRDQLLGKKARGETPDSVAAKVTCGELLDDLLEYAEVNIKATTARVWKLVIEATIRPFFGHLRAAKLTTEKMKEFRKKRSDEGRIIKVKDLFTNGASSASVFAKKSRVGRLRSDVRRSVSR